MQVSSPRAPFSSAASLLDPAQLAKAYPVPQGRTGKHLGLLDSFALPVAKPNGNSCSLMEALQERARADGADQEKLECARAVIAHLDSFDLLATTSSDVANLAVELLLELGQHKLLLRMAQRGGSDFLIKIDAANATALDVLEKLGTDWPPYASVRLVLAPDVAAVDVARLMAFVQCPLVLHVDIEGQGRMEAGAAKAWGALLHQRPIQVFSLGKGPFPPEFFHVLRGVKAKSIEWRMQSFEPALAPAEVKSMAEFMKDSGAAQLSLANAQLDGPTCAALIASQNEWQHVAVRATPDVLALFHQGRHKIHRGFLQPDGVLLNVTDSLLEALHACGMRQLWVNGALDLTQWSKEIQQFSIAHHGVVLLEMLGACFVAREGFDIEPALDALSTDRSVQRCTPYFMPIALEGYKSLDGAAVERLLGIVTPVHLQHVEQLMQQRKVSDGLHQWQVNWLIPLLANDCTEAMVLESMNQIDSPWRVVDSTEPPSSSSPLLATKLVRFQGAQVPASVVRMAVGNRLHADPTFTAHAACRAFIRSGQYALDRELHEWRALGFRFMETWLRGASPLVEEALSSLEDPLPLKAVGPRVSPEPVTSALLNLDPWGSREALLQRYADKAAAINERDPLERALSLGVGEWIASDFTRWPLAPGFLRRVGSELLDEGQGKLFRGVVPHGRQWEVTVATATAATELVRMDAWPASEHKLILRVDPGLGASDIQRVVDYASKVEPDLLTMRIALQDGIPASYGKAMVQLMAARPYMGLELVAVTGMPFAEADLRSFLQTLEALKLRSLHLHGVQAMSEDLLNAFVQAVQGTRTQRLRLTECSGNWMAALLSCQPWHELHVPGSPDMAQAFKPGHVRARRLKLMLKPRLGDDMSNAAEDIIGSCKQAEYLTVKGIISSLTLARGLYANKTIHTVKCQELYTSESQTQEVENWLARNQVFMSLQVTRRSVLPSLSYWSSDSPAFAPTNELAFRKAALRNAFRLSARGAGRGLFGPLLNLDVGAEIGSHLDPATAIVASSTTKNAYLQSRSREIDLLARALMPGGDIGPRVTALYKAGLLLNKTLQSTDFLSNPILNKLDCLKKSGLDDTIAILALARTLYHLLNTPAATLREQGSENAIRDCLEAMAYGGGIPPSWWLREGIGIPVLDGGF